MHTCTVRARINSAVYIGISIQMQNNLSPLILMTNKRLNMLFTTVTFKHEEKMKKKYTHTALVSSTSISVPPKRTINQKANQTQERHSFRFNPCSVFFCVCTPTNPFQMVITCEICAQMAPFVGIFAFQSSAKICQPCMPCHILIAIKTDFHFNVHSP